MEIGGVFNAINFWDDFWSVANKVAKFCPHGQNGCGIDTKTVTQWWWLIGYPNNWGDMVLLKTAVKGWGLAMATHHGVVSTPVFPILIIQITQRSYDWNPTFGRAFLQFFYRVSRKWNSCHGIPYRPYFSSAPSIFKRSCSSDKPFPNFTCTNSCFTVFIPTMIFLVSV
jgi:hypothetical protein